MTGDRPGPGRSPTEQALDLVLYGPLGFLAEARTLIPELAEKGRQRFEAQVSLARMIGQFVVAKGQVELQQAVQRVRAKHLGGERRPPAAPAPARPPAPEPVDEDIPVRVEDAPAPAPPVTSLAIPDYDSLAASQVVPRLAGLSEDELEAVRRYEAAHRGRKTILGKVAQLQAASGS